MTQNKVKILVACHKPDSVYKDEVYIPIHVGRAISKYKDEMSNMIGDDTGDNISEKNPYYCELTAQYWGWKNMDCEYIGLCHYRRYFKPLVTCDNIEKLMGGADIILPSSISTSVPIDKWYADAFTDEDAYIMVESLKSLFPEKVKIIEKYFTENMHFYPCNMFICKKELFNDFASWQFDVLSKIEPLIKISGYSRMKRIFGYFGENMLSLYCVFNNLKVKEYPLIDMIGSSNILLKPNLSKFFMDWIKFKVYKFVAGNYKWNYAAINGLKADGIMQQIENLRLLKAQHEKR